MFFKLTPVYIQAPQIIDGLDINWGRGGAQKISKCSNVAQRMYRNSGSFTLDTINKQHHRICCEQIKYVDKIECNFFIPRNKAVNFPDSS